jgi:hypothetical protein
VTAERAGLDAYEKVLREAEQKRIECAGILILAKEQEHWYEELNGLPKSVALPFPVNMKDIVKKLNEFLPPEKKKGKV